MPYCWKCGAEMKEDARFCHKCGAPVGRRVRREKEHKWWEEWLEGWPEWWEEFGERLEKWWEELWD